MVGRWRCLTRRLVAELLGLDPPRFVHGLLDHQSPLLLALLTALSESGRAATAAGKHPVQPTLRRSARLLTEKCNPERAVVAHRQFGHQTISLSSALSCSKLTTCDTSVRLFICTCSGTCAQTQGARLSNDGSGDSGRSGAQAETYEEDEPPRPRALLDHIHRRKQCMTRERCETQNRQDDGFARDKSKRIWSDIGICRLR